MNNNVNLCVCCGNIIPEGRMICPNCEGNSQNVAVNKPHAKKANSIMRTIFVKGFDTMKEIIMTMVAMLILIVCGALQIIGCIFQLAALATGKVWEWIGALCDKLSNLYYRIKGKTNSEVIEQA